MSPYRTPEKPRTPRDWSLVRARAWLWSLAGLAYAALIATAVFRPQIFFGLSLILALTAVCVLGAAYTVDALDTVRRSRRGEDE